MKKVDWVYNGILIWEKQEIEGIRGCGIMKQITGTFNNNFNVKWRKVKKILPGGESNPGLPRDRRGYLPLYYRGHIHSIADSVQIRFTQNVKIVTQIVLPLTPSHVLQVNRRNESNIVFVEHNRFTKFCISHYQRQSHEKFIVFFKPSIFPPFIARHISNYEKCKNFPDGESNPGRRGESAKS